MVDTGLAGRTVLVTGGAGGIGAAISRAFAAEGARVVLHYLAEQPTAPDGVSWEHALPDGARALAAELGGVAVAADLAEPDAAARLFDAAGPVDTSKAALEAFTRAAALDLGPRGIRVNAVAPGPVQTGWMSGELVEQVRQVVPLGRVGTPEDVADAVVFLAAHQARWITGQVLQAAGGHAL